MQLFTRSNLASVLLIVLAALIIPAGVTAQAPSPTYIASGRMPRTDGTFVVWSVGQSHDQRDADVYATDLRNGQVFPVATGPL